MKQISTLKIRCVTTSDKRSNSFSWDWLCPKRNLGFEIQKNNFGKRICILEIPCMPIFRQNGQLWLFWLKFAQKTNARIRISFLEIPYVPIFRQNDNFDFLDPNLPKKVILGLEFQKSRSGFGISLSKIPCEPTLNFLA